LHCDKDILTNYSRFDYKIGFENEKIIRKKAGFIINELKKNKPGLKSVLDVGCGAGFMIDELKVFFPEVVGIEPSVRLAQYAKRKYKIKIFNDYLTKNLVNKINQKFDAVLASHVIEHVTNAKEFLELLGKLLKKNGILYIETPNYSSWLRKTEGRNYTFLTPPEHLFIYSKKSLHKIIKDLSWQAKIQNVKTYSDTEHVIGVIRIIKKNLFSKFIACSNKNIYSNPNLKNSRKKIERDKKKASLFCLLSSLIKPFFNAFYKGSYLVYIVKK